MNITIISLDNWGYNKHIKNVLEEKGHTVNHIDFNTFVYKYPNVFFKAYNFILKLLFKKNLKAIYYGKKINTILNENNQIQDIILTIKGDFIDPDEILKFKKYTKKSIAFFNDSIDRCPRIINVISSFDDVFSFEKNDCNKYNLKFAPNWIYDYKNNPVEENFDYQVFNISSKDKRLPIISRIAAELKSQKINYQILVYDKKNKTRDNTIQYITKHIPLAEVKKQIENSQVLLDVNRPGQEGLTFRVLESLGWNKKLITTNTDIINYDFYNSNNILVIDEKAPVIPLSFFKKKYEKIPDTIFNQYTLNGWIENVIFSNLK